MSKKIIVFDTTLRDGEQSPGAALNKKEKVTVAKQLIKLGVDVIETGFPISSPCEAKSVAEIAKITPGHITVCAFARAVEKDIDIAYQTLKKAKKPRINVVISTSDIHLKYQLRKTRREVLAIIEEMVKKAKSYFDDIQFCPMDATRTDFNYLVKACKAAVSVGAKTLMIPDTLGYSYPEEYGKIIKRLVQRIPGAKNGRVVLAAHCHDDLGLATANSLAAIKNGARQVECTINGLGERAGNAALEEIVMLLKTRKDLKFRTSIDTKQIIPTSKLVIKTFNIPVQPNKAVVGKNAFAHASGIHQDGYLKKKESYETIKPAEIGLKRGKIILGPRSGRHALKHRLLKLGYRVDESKLSLIYKDFLLIADVKKVVSNKDLKKLMKRFLK